MITHISHEFVDLEALGVMLQGDEIAAAQSSSSAVLVQIYSAAAAPEMLGAVVQIIAASMPAAIIVGATTVGEISGGRHLTGSTVVGFSFFQTSTLSLIMLPCIDEDAAGAGAGLGEKISRCSGKVAGVLLLATPLSIDAAGLLKGIESKACGSLIFGGGAGDYAAMQNSLVFAGDSFFSKGAVAVVFAGDELHLESGTYLGWRPLSKSMRVSSIDGLVVETVDDMPAFEVYRRYLNIQNDDAFFLNALEFPFLFERNGELLARVPVAVTPSGGLQFVADIEVGEKFSVGYGDIDLIVQDAAAIHHRMAEFSPQAVFLYSCGCRRFLMQTDVDLETLPFERLAPTFGFYTYGEFLSSENPNLLNSTMVAVGLREGEARTPASLGTAAAEAPAMHADPYAHKHTRVVARLLRFIDAVTAELEASNREITKLMLTDRLTQLANRIRLDQALDENMLRAIRYGTPFSVILMDIDHFKQVNDAHGHLVGDEVLVRTAEILSAHTRALDTVGRWGGEEFMIVAPCVSAEDAARLAEKLRGAVEACDFPKAGKKTASFGVAQFAAADDLDALIGRADAALYSAKNSGRNQVRVAPAE